MREVISRGSIVVYPVSNVNIIIESTTIDGSVASPELSIVVVVQEDTVEQDDEQVAYLMCFN